ncbi:hypothetical protein ACHAXN_007167 [Cyclotella atomus]
MSNPYLINHISVMQQQERSETYRCSDYMNMSFTNSMCPDDRQALCNWCYKTVAACNGVSPATAIMAISYFDRFMSSNSNSAELALTDIRVGQLAFITCFVIALKVHSGFKVDSDFVSNVICRDMYGADEIVDMEIELLRSLGWHLNGPTSYDFIDGFLQLVQSDIDGIFLDSLTRCSKALATLAITRYDVALQYPSAIAFTSICCALQYLEVVPSVDSVTVLRYMISVSGLDFNDHETKRLLDTMVGIIRELFNDFPNRGYGGTADKI